MAPVIVKFTDASLGYDKKAVLTDFNFEIHADEKLLLLGPNGSGKSTLLKSILKIIPVITGSMEINGTISYCKQDYQNINFPITVEEVVSMGLYSKNKLKNLTGTQKKAIIQEALKQTDSLHLKKRLFNTLSGGERQRVSIARCFCQNYSNQINNYNNTDEKHSLLLLDEPSSFMDAESQNSLTELLLSSSFEKLSVIAVTHDEKLIKTLNWKSINLGKAYE